MRGEGSSPDASEAPRVCGHVPVVDVQNVCVVCGLMLPLLSQLTNHVNVALMSFIVN